LECVRSSAVVSYAYLFSLLMIKDTLSYILKYIHTIDQRFLPHSVGVISQWIRWFLNSCGTGDSHLNPNNGRFSVTLMKVGISFYQRIVLLWFVYPLPFMGIS